ncbi:MAG TPA: ABC transporter substrate-binding protein [Stellaceae bacterium]|nr:ABC transporter substrate-binding protein [Stellaceae bacterium]
MRFRAVLGAAACLWAALATASADPVAIRTGWAVVPASLTPLFTAKPGLVRHLGQSYTLDLVHFAATPQQLAGFAAGEVDFASVSYSTLALAVENAGISDLRVVIDVLSDGAHGAYSNEFMVLKDGPIRAIEDLRGKAFATSGAGSSGDMAMRLLLRKHGVDDKAVTFVEVQFPNMKSMLLSGKADIITAITPFSMDGELREKARTLFTQVDALGPIELLMMAGHAPFLAKNRAAVVDFLEDYLRVQRWFMDPANHKEAVAIVANFTKRPPAFYEPWLFTATGDDYRPPDGIPDLAGVEADIKTEYEMGYVKAPLEVAPYADLSLVKEAAARLGRD